MRTFTFNFLFNGANFMAECEPIPLDGSTAMYITPLDNKLYSRYGTKMLTQMPDGRLTAPGVSGGDERIYLVAVGQGLAAYFNGGLRPAD